MKTRILYYIPFAIPFLSTLLFVIQGGFGAGHGRFDFLIGLLSLPTLYFIDYFARGLILDSQLLTIIWFPFSINYFLFWLPAIFIYKRINNKRRGSK